MEDTWVESRGNVGGSQIAFDDDDSDGDDLHMYPADMNEEEMDAYQAAVWVSKESEWQGQQKISFFRKQG